MDLSLTLPYSGLYAGVSRRWIREGIGKDGLETGEGEHVAGRDPGCVLELVELAADGGVCGDDDGLVHGH